MLNADSGSGICIVMAKLESRQDYKEFLAAFGDKLPKPTKSGTTTFLAEGRVVQLASTGTKTEPAMRAVIMTPTEK